MSPCSGPLGSTLTLIGALKWVTVWTSSSTGTGIMKANWESWQFMNPPTPVVNVAVYEWSTAQCALNCDHFMQFQKLDLKEAD